MSCSTVWGCVNEQCSAVPPNSALPLRTTITHCHDTPAQLTFNCSTVCGRAHEGARSLTSFSRDCAAIRFNCRSTARATFLACKGLRWLDVALSYSVTYTRAPRRRAVPEQRGELSPSTSSTACKEQVPYDVISKLGRVLRRPDRERADQLHAKNACDP